MTQSEIVFTDKIGVRLVQKMGGDHMVVAGAKVSVSGEEALKFAEPGSEESNYGLINYMMKSRHGSVWEHSALTFFVHAPILCFENGCVIGLDFLTTKRLGAIRNLSRCFGCPVGTGRLFLDQIINLRGHISWRAPQSRCMS